MRKMFVVTRGETPQLTELVQHARSFTWPVVHSHARFVAQNALTAACLMPTSLRVTLIAVLVRPEQPSVWVTLAGPASHLTRLEDRNDFPHLQCHRFWKEKMADLSGYFERLL